jgi:hypothetical protein
MGDVGIRLTKPRYDAKTAGDSDYIYNSAWPSLTQVIPGFTTTAFNGTPGGTITHNLGFPYFALGWNVGTNITAVEVFPDISTTGCTFTNRGTNPPTYNFIHLKVYNVDLSVDIEYPFIRPSALPTGAYDADYGIKIPRRISFYTANSQVRDINSTDMRDFVVHSRCQSPLVMAVKTEQSAVADPTGTYTKIIRYTTPTGVASWVFGYIKNSAGLYLYAPYFSQTYPKTNIETPTTYSIGWSGTDIGATLVVLRDPMFAGTSINATY